MTDMQRDKTKLVIDCSAESRAAFALAAALADSDADILAVLVSSGAFCADESAQWIHNLLAACGRRDIPVYCGRSDARKVKDDTASAKTLGLEHNHPCRFESLPSLGLAESEYEVLQPDAADALIDILGRHPAQSVTLLALGALTNIRDAYSRNPGSIKKAKRIVSCGGSVLYGDVTACSELNYWLDPDAAAAVFACGIPVDMVGLNFTDETAFSCSWLKKFEDAPVYGALVKKYLDLRCAGDNPNEVCMVSLPQLLAVFAATAPCLFTWLPVHAEISCTAVTRGEALVDMVDAWKQEKNARIAISVQITALMEMLTGILLQGAAS